MLKFLYTTDLHGDIGKYEAVLACAVKRKYTLIHLGADLLPKGSDIMGSQKRFVRGYLRDFYTRAREAGITILASFGNDDIYTRKKYFREYATLLDDVPEYKHEDYSFMAYSYVPDYPFGLKTACKLDSPGWKCPDPYIARPVDVREDKGIVIIDDIQQYFLEKGTIEEDLAEIHWRPNMVASIHAPPAGYDLDVCADGRAVGSVAIQHWIARERPMLVLCGHIHESYTMMGIFKKRYGDTWVIQPGQTEPGKRCRVVHIELVGSDTYADVEEIR